MKDMATQWPPSISMYDDPNLMGLELNVLWETAPHDEPILSAMQLPKIGVRVGIFNFKIFRVPQLLADMSMAILWGLDELVGSPPPIMLPWWVNKVFPFEINMDFEVPTQRLQPWGRATLQTRSLTVCSSPRVDSASTSASTSRACSRA